jgi:transposase
MRKQIDGLAALVEQQLGHDARSGDLFVAFNRRGDMARILFWDNRGFCLVSKRLEVGVFRLPWKNAGGENQVELGAEELGRILEGIDLHSAKRKARFSPPEEMRKPRAT